MTTDTAVRVRGLEKSYGDLTVLRGVDLDLARGSIVALLGSNGAGKTTVVRILSTLLRADAGTAEVNGFDVAGEAARVRGSISLTGQFAAVDEVLTGRENLVLVARLRHLPDPDRVAAISARLLQDGRPVVGICWRSMMINAQRRKYFSAIDLWAPILKTPGVTFAGIIDTTLPCSSSSLSVTSQAAAFLPSRMFVTVSRAVCVSTMPTGAKRSHSSAWALPAEARRLAAVARASIVRFETGCIFLIPSC